MGGDEVDRTTIQQWAERATGRSKAYIRFEFLL